ncbi:MAG: polyphosphate kinase 1 [Saprospirales bacterium]|nr:MAG: polyphosphate kinase 1 [Saprospirales bacterium]
MKYSTIKSSRQSKLDIPYTHRDISWLDFNFRVLQEARDPSVPLFERIKFLAIYSNNLDEFFRVRVANNRNLHRIGKKTRKRLDFDPRQILKDVVEIVNQQQIMFNEIFEDEILPELKTHNIELLRKDQLSEQQMEFIDEFFQENMLPFVQPVLLVDFKVRPFLNNGALYLAILLQELNPGDDTNPKQDYAIVKIPSDHLPRFIQLPSIGDKKDIIILDEIVRHSIEKYLFPGYTIIDSYSIKLTRDAELYIDDEYSGDLIEKIKKSLNKRNVGPASRFIYDRSMPAEMLDYLMELFSLEPIDILQEGRYHNNSDFFKFPDFDLHHLKNHPMPPIPYPALEDAECIFDAIAKRDHLNHPPYHSYESVIRFFEQAASDPDVTHLKVVQYRVARKSRIMEALIKAAKAGKQVTVFIEVKARFDEEMNLMWGERLQKAGINVHYSFPGLKVHSKIALISKVEDNQPVLYTYLSTGNFHEDTVKVYSDLGLFTADKRITSEVARLFHFLETVKLPKEDFDHLLVGQFNLRSELVRLVKKEIEVAKNGQDARIILKMNSLQDPSMIELLYEAHNAGVKIDLIIRGINSLVPGVLGFSEKINAISIVDRFLEHARVFVFHNQGEENVYISSADWMVRNLSYRIETVVPILDPYLKKEILDLLQIQLRDNVKSRDLHFEKINNYRTGKGDLNIRTQHETYYYYKRKEDIS